MRNIPRRESQGLGLRCSLVEDAGSDDFTNKRGAFIDITLALALTGARVIIGPRMEGAIQAVLSPPVFGSNPTQALAELRVFLLSLPEALLINFETMRHFLHRLLLTFGIPLLCLPASQAGEQGSTSGSWSLDYFYALGSSRNEGPAMGTQGYWGASLLAFTSYGDFGQNPANLRSIVARRVSRRDISQGNSSGSGQWIPDQLSSNPVSVISMGQFSFAVGYNHSLAKPQETRFSIQKVWGNGKNSEFYESCAGERIVGLAKDRRGRMITFSSKRVTYSPASFSSSLRVIGTNRKVLKEVQLHSDPQTRLVYHAKGFRGLHLLTYKQTKKPYNTSTFLCDDEGNLDPIWESSGNSTYRDTALDSENRAFLLVAKATTTLHIISPDGNRIQNSDPALNWAWQVIPKTDGGCLVVSTKGNKYGLMILEFDRHGNLTGKETFGPDSTVRPKDAWLDRQGGLVITGGFEKLFGRKSLGGQDAFLLRLKR